MPAKWPAAEHPSWGDKLIVVRADDLDMISLLAQEVEDRSNREELAVRRIRETLRREAK